LDKLLFSIDTWFTHFGIAKSMQEKNDLKLYSIIDVDEKAKEFFLDQKIVKFEKSWFYLDNIGKSKKPDLEYLKYFEKKYDILISSIVNSDRNFHHEFNVNYKFSRSEILSLIENSCKFYEKILDDINPDFLITYIPISFNQFLLHQMCKSKNIKILILGPVRFGNRMMISEDPLKIDFYEEQLSNLKIGNRSLNELKEYMNKFDAYLSLKDKQITNFESNKFLRYKAIINYFLHSSKGSKKRYSNFGKTKSHVLITKLKRSFNRHRRQSFINKHFLKTIGHSPYVYFPLHFEPERLFLIDVPFFDNQLSIISNISKSLPVDYNLYVKEHPMMKTQAWRDITFYKKLMDLPNVKLIHPSVNPSELIQNSSLVITIAGTTGQEATLHEIPTLTFSNQIYSILSSVTLVDKIEELPKLIKSKLNSKVNLLELNQLIDVIENNSFEFDHKGISSDFAYRFGFKGPIMDSYLPTDKINKFLNEYKDTFDMLAIQHMKKINQHKEHEIKSTSNTK
jgi:hypothetical protein